MGQAARRWVVFDVGEVLIDETRVWRNWAETIGVPAFTFMAVLGAVVAAGGDYRDALRRLGLDDWIGREAEVEARYGGFRAADLYADALPGLAGLREGGWAVGVIANQPASRSTELRVLGVEPDVMAMSGELGVEKPSPAFFARMLELCDAEPADVTYVGDRVDNDVLPSLAAGITPVWLRRGPWGALQRLPEDVTVLQARSLLDLPTRL